MSPRTDTARVELVRFAQSLASMTRNEGLAATARNLTGFAIGHATLPVNARRRSGDRFIVGDVELPYTFARYNNSFLNERSVEISLAKWFLGDAGEGRMLEVGNVLGHYGISGHTVLDKYETIAGVLNDDIVSFRPSEPYDIVVSISTLEHVGWDETPRQPERVVDAFDSIVHAAGSTGRILVTCPLGYNSALDDAIKSGRISLPEQFAMVRVSRGNHWVQTDVAGGFGRPYGSTYRNANAIYVGRR